MAQSKWFELRDEVKASQSCIDFLHSEGFNVFRHGQPIYCPSFIRPGSDSKSFTVYDDHCFDFVTNTPYDIIDLEALAHHNGDKTAALEALAGRKLPPKVSEQHSALFNDQQSKFSERIDFWHSELLKNPTVNPDGNPRPILTYLAERGISEDLAKSLKLGYSPKQQRLMIPYFNRSHQPCYVVGRSMLKGKDPKYQYIKLDNEDFSEILDKVIFGIDSIKPGFFKYDEYHDQELGQVIKLSTYPLRYDYLAVCEGIFDVLSFRCEGWAAVTGKLAEKQNREFLDTCRLYRDKKQKIFICFDNDKAGQDFQRKMALLLFRNGIPFVAGHLPNTFTVTRQGRPDFGKTIHIKDVSDYYAAGGSLDDLVKNARDGMDEIAHLAKDEDELQQFFTEASRCCDQWEIDKLKRFSYYVAEVKIETDTDKDGNIIRQEVPYARFNPKAVNFMYAQAMKPLQDSDIAHFVEEKHKLIYDTLGQFYEYRHGVWEAMNDLLIMQEIIGVMNSHVSANKLAAVLRFLKAELASNIQFNSKHNMVFKNGTLWLDEEPKNFDLADRTAHNPYFNPADPLYHMPSNFKKHSQEDMSTIQLPYCFDPNARNDVLERAVRDWTNHKDGSPDDEKYRLIKQMFGYILFVKNTLQKFFVLKGDGANGKSTCMHCIEAMLGRDHTTSLQLSRLSSEFDPMVLKHSRVNLCYDAQTSIEQAQEALKAVIGGDQITAAHKGVDAESFTTNAKFIVSANKFFSANDLSQGLLRRMLFIAFNNTFTPKAGEPSIEDEIMKDLPGLFNFAYEGYKDLKASGHFVETEEQAALLDEFREQLSPMILFAREQLYSLDGSLLEDAKLSAKAVYDLYAEWCKDNGEKALGRTKFMPEIKQIIRIDEVIPEPYKDKDSGEWIFVFPEKSVHEEELPDQPQDGQDTQKRISAQPDRQEIQEASKSYEQTAQKSVEESASVHSAPVSGVQKTQQAQPAEETTVESRQSSEPLPEQVDPAQPEKRKYIDPAKKRELEKQEQERKRELAKQEEHRKLEAEAEANKRQIHIDGIRVEVPTKESDPDFKYNENKAREFFLHLKRAGRDWMQKLTGQYLVSIPYGDECVEYWENIGKNIIQQLAVYLKKKPSLRIFLPGIDDLIDFGEA